MIDKPEQTKGGVPHLQEFIRELALFSPPEHRDDAHDFLLIDPSTTDIVRTARKAARTKRFGDFSGFRAIKLFNQKTEEARVIVWPSFCWTHHHVISAVKKFQGFKVVEETRMNFDEASQGFSDGRKEMIRLWLEEKRTKPLTARSIREEY